MEIFEGFLTYLHHEYPQENEHQETCVFLMANKKSRTFFISFLHVIASETRKDNTQNHKTESG
jgi:hypothetical protein